MKLRTLIVAAVLVAGFVVFTDGRWLPERLRYRFDSAPLWAGPDVARSATLIPDELNNVQIYKSAHDATVNITSIVYRRGFFFEVYPVKGSGSGFIVKDDGLIVTNNHVVSGSPKLQVTLGDKSRYEAQILLRDPANDLALIKINPRKKVTSLRLGDSDNIQVGQKVLAIGNPFGLEGTLTTGIVSSLGRDLRDETGRELQGLIQTDAAINPGNSGGPLLDSQGSVIAVNTAIYGPGSNIGIGFAMPINRAKQLLDGYQSGKKFDPPRLGVSGVYIAGDLAEALELPAEGGFLVDEVEAGSDAASAGIRGARRSVIIGNTEVGIGGDLIMAIDGQPVSGSYSLSRAMSRKRPGDRIELTILRNGRRTTITVRLGGGGSEAL